MARRDKNAKMAMIRCHLAPDNNNIPSKTAIPPVLAGAVRVLTPLIELGEALEDSAAC